MGLLRSFDRADSREQREALLKNRFRVELMVPRFLPYTFKSRLPNSKLAVRLYLMFPIVWRLLGKQMLAIAVRPD